MANVVLAASVMTAMVIDVLVTVVVGRDWCDRGPIKAALIVPALIEVALQVS